MATKILELVAAQTGYPPEMLDLELDLEADLGIDTVKQAELFAAVRETYDIARDDQLKLRDYPTLNHVIGFVHTRLGTTPKADSAADVTPVSGSDATAGDPSSEGGASTEGRFPRRMPVPVLRPPLAGCRPTGVELVAGARVVVFPDAGGVADEVTRQLAERDVQVLHIEGTPTRDELEATLAGWLQSGPITGVLWLAALDQVDVATLDPTSWVAALHVRVKLLATTMRALYETMTAGRFLVTGVRLGGHFGYDAAGAQDALGGATSGFTKALARERADATVKVVDVATTATAADVAGALLAEIERDPGAVEVGHADGLRWSIGVAEVEIDVDPDRRLGADDVFVVTGAAGSIVSAITADLAAASHGTFHLLDLTPEPSPDDADLARFVADRDGLKRDLAQRIVDRGERATPALVERELARMERSRAALDAIQAVQGVGGTVHWYQADLTDAAAVAAAMATIVERSGKVDVLLHCAGLEISRFLPDKTDREYDLVFDVKSNGWFHLLHALGDAPLGAAVVFSSIAGRFGNGGQTDYSAANDLLCKSVSALAAARPGTRGVAIDWTAWAGIGMASRGSIPKMMAMAGIDMLPAEVGVPVVRHELEAVGSGGELVMAGTLGVMLDEPADGGVDGGSLLALGRPGPMLGTVDRCTRADGLVVRTTLGVDQPFLDHHRIDGTPVLPGVMGIEAFVEAAGALAPGWRVAAVRDIEFLAPFKLYRDEPRVAEIRTRFTPDGDRLLAHCQLIGRRTLAGQPELVTTHFTGVVELVAAAVERVLPDALAVPVAPQGAVGSEAVYRIYFHGPTYQVLGAAWFDGEHAVGALADGLPPNHAPADLVTSAFPRLVELCFQTAGVHQLGTAGVMALPARVARLELVADAAVEPDLPIHAIVTPGLGAGGTSDAVVMDGAGRTVLTMSGYATIDLPGGPDIDALAPLRAAMELPAPPPVEPAPVEPAPAKSAPAKPASPARTKRTRK